MALFLLRVGWLPVSWPDLLALIRDAAAPLRLCGLFTEAVRDASSILSEAHVFILQRSVINVKRSLLKN
jgi:hypothetical protein